MCLTINRSKAYEVKDQIITIIEENEGMEIVSNDGGNIAIWDDITEVLTTAAYRTTGACPDDWTDVTSYVGVDRDGKLSDAPSVCIKKTDVNYNDKLDSGNFTYLDESIPSCYYTVVIFYKLDIPVLNDVFSFSITGQTKTLYSSEYCGDN